MLLVCLASVEEQHRLLDEHNKKKLGPKYEQEGHAPVKEVEHWFSLVDVHTKAATSEPMTICEIGFNAGHSAAAWTDRYPHARYISFDVFNKNVSHAARAHLRTRNIQYVIGDTAKTLLSNEFACDVISIDGDHSFRGAVTDLLNMQRHANPDHLLIVDDLSCKFWWCHQPTQAWELMVSSGNVNATECKNIGCCTGWCWGKYTRVNK